MVKEPVGSGAPENGSRGTFSAGFSDRRSQDVKPATRAAKSRVEAGKQRMKILR
jgi:hypothetical protein